jgi:hypothetical protein
MCALSVQATSPISEHGAKQPPEPCRTAFAANAVEQARDDLDAALAKLNAGRAAAGLSPALSRGVDRGEHDAALALASAKPAKPRPDYFGWKNGAAPALPSEENDRALIKQFNAILASEWPVPEDETDEFASGMRIGFLSGARAFYQPFRDARAREHERSAAWRAMLQQADALIERGDVNLFGGDVVQLHPKDS